MPDVVTDPGKSAGDPEDPAAAPNSANAPEPTDATQPEELIPGEDKNDK